jgi:hypothetical protein
MATNPTNSTSVNITSLPKAQLAVNSDYFILQTNNGTQIISFSALNVIKTDISGNATVVGSMSGNDAQFNNTRVLGISASKYCTSTGTQGITLPINQNSREYYDSFTISNGLITSAVPTSVDYTKNPIYLSLYTQLTAASADLVARQRIYDFTFNDASVKISAGQLVSSTLNWPSGSPSLVALPAGAIKPSSFIITPNGDTSTPTLTSVPYISTTDISFSPSGNSLSFKIRLSKASGTDTYFNARLLVVY